MLGHLTVAVAVQASDDATQKLPPSLLRRFEVTFQPRSSMKPMKMRGIKAASMGHLVTMRVREPDPCL